MEGYSSIRFECDGCSLVGVPDRVVGRFVVRLLRERGLWLGEFEG